MKKTCPRITRMDANDFGNKRTALSIRVHSRDSRAFLFFFLFVCAALGIAQDLPPTSVSPDQPLVRPAARPARNWIDQTQAQADAKSIGCNECHQGIEPMHKAEQNVVLGCTDCHG